MAKNRLFSGKGIFLLALAISATVLFSGCIRTEFSHKISRNGNSDINFSIESDYLSMMGLDSPKGLEKMGFATENAVFVQGEVNKATLVWKGVPPGGLAVYEEKEGGVSERESNSSAIIPKTGLVREFKFPYYYYNLSMESRGIDAPDNETTGNEYAEALYSSIKMNYRLETFGKIVETNGAKLSDNSVLFDLKEKKSYYVVFRDFFLSSIFGGFKQDSCTLDWQCSEWSACSSEGLETRTCEKVGSCENYVFSPETEQSCSSNDYSESGGSYSQPSNSQGGFFETPSSVPGETYDERNARIKAEYENAFLSSAKEANLEKTAGNWKVKITRIGFFKHLKYTYSGDEITDFRFDIEVTNNGPAKDDFFWLDSKIVAGSSQYENSYHSELETSDVYPGVTVKGSILFEDVPQNLSGPVKIVAGSYYDSEYEEHSVEFDTAYP